MRLRPPTRWATSGRSRLQVSGQPRSPAGNPNHTRRPRYDDPVWPSPPRTRPRSTPPMRIERVTTDLIPLQPPRPLASAGAQVSSLDYVMVRLQTADGLDGLGYACIYAGREARALQALIEDLAGLVTGEDARFRGRVWNALWRA